MSFLSPQNRFMDVKDSTEDNEEENERDEDTGMVSQMVQTEMEGAPRESSNNPMSSGVLLQPKTLVENHMPHLHR